MQAFSTVGRGQKATGRGGTARPRPKPANFAGLWGTGPPTRQAAVRMDGGGGKNGLGRAAAPPPDPVLYLRGRSETCCA